MYEAYNMLFNVTGLTVEISQYFYTDIDVGCCYAYIMYVQHTYFEGGEDSHEGGGGGRGG